MSEVGAYEAKTHFSELLERVARGERIVVTRRGRQVAYLTPAGTVRPPAEVVDEVRKFREGKTFGGGLHAAIEQGRL